MVQIDVSSTTGPRYSESYKIADKFVSFRTISGVFFSIARVSYFSHLFMGFYQLVLAAAS